MDRATLVAIDIAGGRTVVDALERAGLKLNVALWAYLSEYEDVRLVLASEHFDQTHSRQAYARVRKVLQEAGVSSMSIPPLLILRMTDPLVRGLRETFGNAADVEGMRLGGQSFGGRFIEDGYVYRIR